MSEEHCLDLGDVVVLFGDVFQWQREGEAFERVGVCSLSEGGGERHIKRLLPISVQAFHFVAYFLGFSAEAFGEQLVGIEADESIGQLPPVLRAGDERCAFRELFVAVQEFLAWMDDKGGDGASVLSGYLPVVLVYHMEDYVVVSFVFFVFVPHPVGR